MEQKTKLLPALRIYSIQNIVRVLGSDRAEFITDTPIKEPILGDKQTADIDQFLYRFSEAPEANIFASAAAEFIGVSLNEVRDKIEADHSAFYIASDQMILHGLALALNGDHEEDYDLAWHIHFYASMLSVGASAINMFLRTKFGENAARSVDLSSLAPFKPVDRLPRGQFFSDHEVIGWDLARRSTAQNVDGMVQHAA